MLDRTSVPVPPEIQEGTLAWHVAQKATAQDLRCEAVIRETNRSLLYACTKRLIINRFLCVLHGPTGFAYKVRSTHTAYADIFRYIVDGAARYTIIPRWHVAMEYGTDWEVIDVRPRAERWQRFTENWALLSK